MPDQEQMNTPDTPGSDNGAAEPNVGSGQEAVFKKIIDYVDARISAGESKEEVTEDVAAKLGWTPDQLIETINTASKDGDVGRGVLQATATLLTSVQQQSNEREGKREVSSLANDKKLGEAFEEHEKGFRAWLKSKGLSYGTLAEPGLARKNFDYYLKTETDYLVKQQAKRDEEIRAEERRKIEEEMNVRRRVPPTPGIGSGAHPEGGGSLKSFIEATTGSEEASETQISVMSGLGLDEERQKSAMKQHAQKTAFGTPLDFVKVKNEGGV